MYENDYLEKILGEKYNISNYYENPNTYATANVIDNISEMTPKSSNELQTNLENNLNNNNANENMNVNNNANNNSNNNVNNGVNNNRNDSVNNDLNNSANNVNNNANNNSNNNTNITEKNDNEIVSMANLSNNVDNNLNTDGDIISVANFSNKDNDRRNISVANLIRDNLENREERKVENFSQNTNNQENINQTNNSNQSEEISNANINYNNNQNNNSNVENSGNLGYETQPIDTSEQMNYHKNETSVDISDNRHSEADKILQDLTSFYPEIYKIVTPMIEVAVDKISHKKIDFSVLEKIINEIYDALVVEVGPTTRRNSLLYDLIKILILDRISKK